MAAQTANLFVGLGDETLNPVCDLAKRIEVAFRERLRFVYVVEILEKIEIGGLCCHTSLFWCDA